jgi:HlyD family secretion protein
MFLVALLISSVMKVDVVVVGSGRVVTDTAPIMLQPLDTAIIRELNVHAGDEVKKGQVLATLDPTFTAADLASLTSQQRALLAQRRRLEAELSGQPFDAGPVPTTDDQIQANLYTQRRAQYDSQLRVYDQDIALRQANLHTTQDDLASSTKQLAVAKDVETMRSTLMQSQIGSKLQYYDALTNRMHIEQEQQDATNRLVELQHELQSKQAERQAFVDQWKHQTLEDLVNVRTELAKIDEGQVKASRMNDLVVLTAPEDGVVLDVAKRSVGSVMRGAEPLVTIVPDNAKLVGEITIGSGDVGYTATGDDVVVKIDAFPYQRHGLLPGKLLSISEESFPANGGTGSGPDTGTPLVNDNSTHGGAGGSYHRGRVELLSTKLEHLPKGARLIPGMTMSADIKVGTRSVIGIFLFPLTRALNDSIREP